MGAFPQLLAAYEHKERFYHIWDCASRRDAEQALAAWIDDIPVTNAFTESINRLAKDKNRDGRGYSFEVMRARMLYQAQEEGAADQGIPLPGQGHHDLRHGSTRAREELRCRSINLLGKLRYRWAYRDRQPINPDTHFLMATA